MFEVDDFLNIHIDIVTLFELEIKRKTKKKIEGRKWEGENEEKFTNIDTNLYKCVGCNSDVIFFTNKEEKCKEKQLHFVVNCKVSQNHGKNIHIYIYIYNCF